jgi:hypothetical protein
MKHNERNRAGTIAVEYIMVLVLVIGLGASLVALQTSLSNTIKKTSTNISNTATTTTTSTGNSTTSGNLIQTSNTGSGTESSNNATNSTSNGSTTSVSVKELSTTDTSGNTVTAGTALYGVKTDLDTSNTYLASMVTSLDSIRNAIIGNNTSGTTGIINAIKTTDTNNNLENIDTRIGTIENQLGILNNNFTEIGNNLVNAVKLSGGGSVTIAGDNGTLTTENQTTLTTSGTLSGDITWSCTTGDWSKSIIASTSNFQDDAVLTYYWTYDGVKTDNTTKTYTPTKEDIGHRIAFVVKDSTSNYTGSVARAVTITQAELTGTVTFSQSGFNTVVLGRQYAVLTATVNNSNNSNWTYQWYRGNTAISGATSSTYALASSDNGQTLKCVATITSSYKDYYVSTRLSLENTYNVSDSDYINLPTSTSLDDYSWAELKIIANDLSKNNTSSEYYSIVLSMMQSGSTKTFTTTSTVIGTNVKVRIIGICQDQKTSDGTAGLTFQTTHALATAYKMNTSDTNTNGWGSTAMRTWLNGTVYNALPSDLKGNIVQVKKYYGSTYNSTSSTTSYTSDYLSLLSMRELYNCTNSSYPWYECEGTGNNHNQQYQYYSYKGVTTSNYSLLANMYKDYNGNTPGSYTCWWLRSVYYGSSISFRSVYSDGYYSYDSAGYSYSVVPSFSL